MKKLISCLVVDDEESCLRIIRRHIKKHPQLMLQYATTDPQLARKCLLEDDIALAFIDYDLNTCLGTELLGDIQNSTIYAFIVTGNINITAEILSSYSSLVSVIYKPVSYQTFKKNIDYLLVKTFL